MVCRKPGATLQKSQQTSIFRCASRATVKLFGHPFAKPEGLWHFILQAVAIPGQTVFDPFAGSGSGPIAFATYGMKPIGAEINPTHFSTLISNLKSFYRRAIGEHVTFS